MANREHHLNLNHLPQITSAQATSGTSTANASPIEAPSGATARSPFGLPGSTTRMGNASPSHELGGRLFSKRAREIQAQEGLGTPNPWGGPPTSGGSTPLRETIPESPSQDGFPDFVPPPETASQPAIRRARAGTVPSKFPPPNPLTTANLASNLAAPKSSRPTPSSSPFRPLPAPISQDNLATANSTSALLQRLRAGSLPQRANIIGSSSVNPFASSLFPQPWITRERASTLASIRSIETPSSPASFARDLTDGGVKTLDYLGLAETPQQGHATLVPMASSPAMQPFLSDLASWTNPVNRYRSFSVSAKEKYAEYDGEDDFAAAVANQLAHTQAQIHDHNKAVQAFANATGQLSPAVGANRPRARTTGILDSPLRNRNFHAAPSRLDNSYTPTDMSVSDMNEYEGLPNAMQMLRMNGQGEAGEDHGLEGPTRALWLGSIPTSTTSSSLQAIFSSFGKIESARVLFQKNCGFVNFEEVESAVHAKAQLNGKEIFPGAGPIRIGFAKAPNSNSATPGHYGVYPSPSPDSHAKAEGKERSNSVTTNPHANAATTPLVQITPETAAGPELPDSREEIIAIVRDFGANDQEVAAIEHMVERAIDFPNIKQNIAQPTETSQSRVHDAPKLREIRKRIDNNAISSDELEEIAKNMLPEIAELSSDYLGNTVVQKLFEYCTEETKEAMLQQIAPRLAEIGIHKNGTWAAQKIIETARTPAQVTMIAEALAPYAVPLFLDQYGNYVIQGCLRFGSSYNNFIFEAMLSQLWEIASGRFGARAMRACLESHAAIPAQQRMLAAAIALHSAQLATNANAALLLTWYLDTCKFPRRLEALATRLVPHLVQLCTDKVANLTVLKVIDKKSPPEARNVVIQALFFSQNDSVLEEILSDQAHGATLILKIVGALSPDEQTRQDVNTQVRTVLQRLKIPPSQGYKRLMDEVGLSARGSRSGRDNSTGPSGYHDRNRPSPQRPYGPDRHNSAPYMMSPYGAQTPMDGSMMYADSYNVPSPVFTPTSINPQQLQYQQMMNGNARNVMQNGFAGMNSPMGHQTPNAYQQGFPNMQNGGMMNGNYSYGQMPYYSQQVPQHANGRSRGGR